MSSRHSEYTVRFEGGNLYLDGALGRRYFPGVHNVAIMLRGGELWLMPLLRSAGGQLLKTRNADGDRVVHLQALLRDWGLDDTLQGTFTAQWDADGAGLRVPLYSAAGG